MYYGCKDHDNKIYLGHSSGIAAYSNYQEAQKRATMELIERDALMRNWYQQKSPNILSRDILPVHVQKRMDYWLQYQRRLFVLSLPSQYGLVFEVIIVSKEYPCFVSGASASLTQGLAGKAILKALEEAEYSLLSHLESPNVEALDPQSVINAEDHGQLYCLEKYISKISWL